MRNIGYSSFLLILTASLLVMPVLSSAAVYKWVDDNGKVHFSDKPPEGDIKADEKIIKPIRNISSSSHLSGFNTKFASKKNPIKYGGQGDSRRIRLENVVMDLEKEDGGRYAIGAQYSGGGCLKKVTTLAWSKGRAAIEAKNYQQQFNKVIAELGYAVEGAGQLFVGQRMDKAELTLAAEIKELQTNSCRIRNRFSKPKTKVNTYLKIKWSVFDILERKIIFEITTEGSDKGIYERSAGDELSISRFKAFKIAVNNLLSDDEVAAIFSSDKSSNSRLAINDSVRNKSNMLPLSLVIQYGNRNSQFTSIVDSLKRASVTVRSTSGHGSGFLVTNDGYVITNSHVVANAKQVVVVFNDIELRADVIRDEPLRDVALLKLRDFSGDALSISKNAPVEGEVIYVIGTPLEEKLSHTVTRGIISAKRTLEDGKKYFQTDAAINPGNSGGPVFNDSGEVIGIAVSGLFNRSGGSLNINFLIPIDEVISSLNIVSN